MKTVYAVSILLLATAQDVPDRPQAVRLCDALSRIEAGERMRVVVSGIYETSYENAIFFDPERRVCAADVQPVTTVELAPAYRADRTLDRLLERDRRAHVTFEGTLEGPGPLKPDDLSLPPMLAWMNRVAGRRYGHMNAYRTRLVVEKVLKAERVAAATPRYAETAAPRRQSTPAVVDAGVPRYPEAAQKAGITGVVVLNVRVEEGRVAAVEALCGDRLLAAAAQENVRTWRFDPKVSANFTTTFAFELEKRLRGSDDNPRIEMHLPQHVRVIGPENGW